MLSRANGTAKESHGGQAAGQGGCTGRAGRMLRFVLGCTRLPDLVFAAPGAPEWTGDRAPSLAWDGRSFSLTVEDQPVLAGNATHEPMRLEVEIGDAEVLGFGAATGAPDRNGARFRLMTLDTLLYAIPGSSYTAFPFCILRDGTNCTAILVATTFPLDVAVESGTLSIVAACDTEGAPLDVIVLRGSIAEVIRDLAALVGHSFLPPAWALGFHQSRWSYRTAEAVLEVARRFRDLDLPADVVHLDIHYMDRYRVFTFHPSRFPQPRATHDALGELGFRTLAIVDPGVSTAPYHAYQTLRGGDMLLKRSDGSPYEGHVWPGATVFPDFTQRRVREVWGRLHEPLVAAGVAGFWNDMNDPVFRAGEVYDPLAEDVQHAGASHRRVRNLYANGMAEATVSGLEALRPGRRPFVLSRSGFLGIQRHAAVWTGDNHSSWEHLRENLHMVLNLGLSGVPISGADVGGFGRGPGKLGAIRPWRPPAELYVRWMELGALMPFFRVHCTLFAPGQEPWSFGGRVLELARRVLQRRYRLLPLLYWLALQAHREGLPIVRPLFMHYDVPRGKGVDQFLLGDGVMAAPVLQPGVSRQQVWLPPGGWRDWHTGEQFDGGCEVEADAALGTTPLFVRVGAALFTAEPRRNADATLGAPLALEVSAPAAGTTGRGSLFLDDGESSTGERFVLHALVRRRASGLELRLETEESGFVPLQRRLELRVPCGYAAALVDDERHPLVPCDLVREHRRAPMLAVPIPLRAGTILIEPDR